MSQIFFILLLYILCSICWYKNLYTHVSNILYLNKEMARKFLKDKCLVVVKNIRKDAKHTKKHILTIVVIRIIVVNVCVCVHSLFWVRISMFCYTYLMYWTSINIYRSFSGKGSDRHKYVDGIFYETTFLNVGLKVFLLLLSRNVHEKLIKEHSFMLNNFLKFDAVCEFFIDDNTNVCGIFHYVKKLFLSLNENL